MSKRTFDTYNRDRKSANNNNNNRPRQANQDDSDEELMPRAFPVEGDLNVLRTRAPENANEYLLQVRWEASQYGDNFVASHLLDIQQVGPVNHGQGPTSYLFQYFNPEAKKKELFTEVTDEWKKGVVEAFVKVKQDLDYARSAKEKGRNVIMLSQGEISEEKKEPELTKRKQFKDIFNEKDAQRRKKPVMLALSQLDSVQAENLLEWLCDELPKIEAKNEIVNAFQCMWIYSILVLFDKPLLPDICGAFNEVLTYMIKVYEKLKDTEFAAAKDPEEEVKAGLVVNSLVIMEYFGQRLYNM